MRSFVLGLAAVLCAGAVLSWPAPAVAKKKGTRKANKPAAIVITPSGGTFKSGDTVQFSAVALNKSGAPIPGVTFSFSSSQSGVFSVNASGQGVAGQQGTATVIAKGAGKAGKITVSVVPANSSLAAFGVGQINHILEDGDWIYWTEVDKRTTRVRKIRKSGGAIFDLAAESNRDSRGLLVAYAHLQQVGEDLFFSRQTIGFFEHWSLRRVPKAGGAVSEVLPEDVSAEPLLASGWGVCGKYVVAAIAQGDRINLSSDTHVAVFDTETGLWTPIIAGGNFRANLVFVLASDGEFVYVRGLTESGQVTIVRARPEGLLNSFEPLLTQPGPDLALRTVGTTDGQNVYFWSGRSEQNRLLAMPVTGGTANQLFSGPLGEGTTTDGTHLYWAGQGGTVLRMPLAGGAVSTAAEGVSTLSTLGALAVDDTSLFVARKQKRKSDSIHRVNK